MIGVDLDNTILNYDDVYRTALKMRGIRRVEGISPRKILKDHFARKPSGNLDWTLLQGEIYSSYLAEAKPFEGCIETLCGWLEQGHQIRIISHKTRYPAVGPAHDFHSAADQWLRKHLLDRISPKLHENLHILFLDTIEEKANAIKEERCAIFVDDLASVLEHEHFPAETIGIHFGSSHCSNWGDVQNRANDALQKSKNAPAKTPIHYKRDLPQESFERLLVEIEQRMSKMTPLNGGINNAVYRIEALSGKRFCGKYYKVESNDPRDRMLHEVRFLEYCEANAIDCVPKIFAIDWKNKAVLLSFIEGETWDASVEPKDEIWQQFRDFFDRLQQHSSTPESKRLPRAAEGADSLQAHLGILQKRRDFWRQQALTGELDEQTKAHILDLLEPQYQVVARKCIARPDFRTTFPSDQRVISPSDFGLHNAIVNKSGKLQFIDFEYAGWDDFQKAFCDFELQPRYHSSTRTLNTIKEKNGSTISPGIYELLKLKWKYITLANDVRKSKTA